MHPAAILIWIISFASIIAMLIRPRGIAEAYWACGGAVLLVLTRLLPLRQAGHAIHEGVDVYLFLAGMMILAELARLEGVFEWIADVAARRAKGSPDRLFLLVYLCGAVVTALLSNDATAVVLTPAVLAVVRKAKASPRPYLIACAFVANACSFVFPISNPANLVVFGRAMPSLGGWLRIFILPSIAAAVVTFLCLRLIFRSELRGILANSLRRVVLDSEGKLALAGLLVASAVLITASGLGLPLGAPTCGAALLATLVVAWRDRRIPLKVARGVSWSVLPLVAGLFVIVQTLQDAGMLRLAVTGLEALARLSSAMANLAAAFSVGLVCNGVNNLPVGLISRAAIQQAHVSGAVAHSVLIGVDLGPNLSVTGSLATILWLIALRREEVEVTVWQFLKVGLVAMPLALAASVVALRR